MDAGLVIAWLTTDLEGNARLQGIAYDIGAYEGTMPWEVYLPFVLR